MVKEKIEAIRTRQATAKDKLKSAQVLFESKQWKDAVSRAYYAMYYAAVALLLTKNQTPKSHQAVLNLFGQHFVKGGKIDKSYALMLRVIKEMREDADYRPEIKLTSEDAREALGKAEKFIKKCNELINKEVK